MVRLKSKFTRHLEHQPVLNMHEAGDFFDTFASRVAHQSVHQVPAKPITLQGRSDQNTELAFCPIRIQNETRYAEQFPRAVFYRDERHFSCVVDLCQLSQKRMWKRIAAL